MATLVTKWLGEHRMKALMDMIGCRSKVYPNPAVPIFSNMANADKVLRLGFFQGAVDSLLDNHNIKVFYVMITLAIVNNVLSVE